MIIGAAAIGVLAVLATWLPLFSDSISGEDPALADSGADSIVYVVAGIVVLAIGAFGIPDRASGGGLVAGVATAFTGFFGYLASILQLLTGGEGLGDRGVGFFAMALVPVAGVVAIIASGRVSMSGSDDGRLRHLYAGFGIVASFAVIVGVMLPPLDSPIGFADRNFDQGTWYTQTAYLVFVASLGLAGGVGFALQTRWGSVSPPARSYQRRGSCSRRSARTRRMRSTSASEPSTRSSPLPSSARRSRSCSARLRIVPPKAVAVRLGGRRLRRASSLRRRLRRTEPPHGASVRSEFWQTGDGRNTLVAVPLNRPTEPMSAHAYRMRSSDHFRYAFSIDS